MARVRQLDIRNFRGVETLSWLPSPGINCLIGPGDSGKSTVLDAIDWCLGPRRTLSVSDADFHLVETDRTIEIDVTIGELDDSLKNIETYGSYLRGFDAETGAIDDEPGDRLEPVLTIRLTIGDDLEPHWRLVSERAQAQGLSRGLAWDDKRAIAPSRIGSFASHHLTWQKGSILERPAEEKANVKAELAEAARHARAQFGDKASANLKETLKLVSETARDLGIETGGEVSAMLDAASVSFTSGAISLHDADGVPLKKLGLGSSRLLVAGVQGRVAAETSIALVDEVEHGLEPHRIARFLAALGSKDDPPPLQVFMTTHSPVVLRELFADQLHVVRSDGEHRIQPVADTRSAQASLRKAAEAFLAARIVVCEGATEVGLIRGLDLHRARKGLPSLMAAGCVAVDAGGVDKIYGAAKVFLDLKYGCATLRDDDKQPKAEDEKAFKAGGGSVFQWRAGFAIEDELFASAPYEVVEKLVRFAEKTHGADLVLDHIRSAAKTSISLDGWLAALDDDKTEVLAQAAKTGAWFKRISIMEEAARKIIAPSLEKFGEEFTTVLDGIISWALGDE